MEDRLHFILLFLLMGLFTGVSAIVDFTCITKPRIDIGSEDTYIAAYLHGGDAALSFARTTFTDTTVDDKDNRLGLPTYHRSDPRSSSEGGEISILRLPKAGRTTRIGAFACNAMIAGSGKVNIGTVIISKTADFLPTQVSQTVNLGDPVNLTVTATNPALNYTRWRKDGGDVFRDRSDSVYFDFISATILHTGIYEVHFAGERKQGDQALMRLIVRGCKEHKWNSPTCDRACPDCFNGGVCDDSSGECICPPGFGGELCGNPVGPSRFGQSGSFRCDSAELRGGPTCAGMLFCLPDPYGCSCAAGYQGIDCIERCADGFYGADCAQTCHCMDGIACNRTTGECRDRNCAPGFTGINCQVKLTVDDFTCITKPRIDIGREETYIAAYLHGGDAALSFARTTFTYTTVDDKDNRLGLPSYYRSEPRSSSEGDEISILRLPATGRKTRIGAFACRATMAETSLNSIGTVIMSKTADFLPTRVSQTVNRGDAVNLAVTATNQNRRETRWRKDNGGTVHNDQLSWNMSTVAASNSGVYEVHFRGARSHGNQALMRLLVRGCGRHIWNAPSCDSDCPVCLNGGICDIRSGVCICPPGFGGSFCEILLGRNRFGQTGSFRCDSPGLGGGPTCAGMLFCLPNPYGCSCAAGYQGIDCNETCEHNTYGADCAQKCHCKDGVPCNGTTGECRDRNCTQGFLGINCQVPLPVSELVLTGTNINDLLVSWRASTSREHPCWPEEYLVTCELLLRDQCMDAHELHAVNVTVYTRIVFNDLVPYSTYRVNVTSRTVAGNGTTVTSVWTTRETVPLVAPEFNSSDPAPDSITFNWNPIPCGSARGNITSYETLLTSPGREINTKTVTTESVTFDGLSPCSPYTLEVWPRTKAGRGPPMEVQQGTDTIVPDVVEEFSVTVSGHDELNVQWKASTKPDNSCPVTDYLVTYELINLEQCQEMQGNSQTRNTSTTAISIQGLKAYSKYNVTVTPRNEAGLGQPLSKTMQTGRTAPTATPVNITSVATPNSLSFGWDPVPCGTRGGPLGGYRFWFGKRGDDDYVKQRRTSDGFVTFSSLPVCTSYSFKVQTYSSARLDFGPWTDETKAHTTMIVPDPVAGLPITPLGHDQLDVHWSASSNTNNNCHATDYHVTYELVNFEQCQEAPDHDVVVTNVSMTYTTINGLHAYSSYNVTVTPRNEAGYGQMLSQTVQTGESEPTGTPILGESSASSDNITFTWSQVLCGGRGGAITVYQYKLTKRGSMTAIRKDNTTAMSVTFRGLSPCTSYAFIVRAFNSKGKGPRTNEHHQDAVKIVPDPIEGLTITPLGHDRLDVQWSASSNTNNNCHATEYHVTHELINLEQCRVTSNHDVSTKNVSVTNIVINELHAYSSYNVTVTPRNEAGYGPMLYQTVQTGEKKPTETPILVESSASSDNITFTWSQVPCGGRGGAITKYQYKFMKRANTTVIEKETTTAMSVTFRGLSPCTSYAFIVRAFNNKGNRAGPWTDEYYKDTVVVDEIQSLNLEPSTNEIKASWITAGNEENPCPVTSYCVSYQLLNFEQCQPQTEPTQIHRTVNDTNVNITSMHAYSTYSVQVVPANNAGEKYMNNKTVTTDEGVPLAAPVLDTMLPSNQSVRVSWHPIPCGKRGGNITGYTYELRDASGSMVKTADTTAESVEVDGLSQGASYLFRLWAFTRVGPGPWKEGDFEIPKDDAAPPTPPGSSPAGSILGVVVFILVAAVLALLIAVVVKKRRQQRTKALGKDSTGDGVQDIYGKGDQDGVELKNLPSTSGYKPYASKGHEPVRSSSNPPKSTDQVAVDVLPKAGPSTTSTDSVSAPGPSTSTKAPVKPKPYVNPSTKPKLKASAKASPSFPQAGPVAMAHLAEYIKSRTAGKVNGFQQDYESIPGEPIHPWTVAKQDHNKKNNRYNNILAYDHSRVVLECLEDNPHSDYINASYINGYKQDYKYIASQGPTKASVKDMWRMVWQERVGKIVMLTNLIEHGKGKCEQYWPDDIADYGELFVRNVDETKHANFIVRTFHVSKSTEPEGEYRELTQFHYTTWPDMKPPESSPLLQFVRTVRATDASQHGPIVVHCSAGVGRTGTFITLDSMLEMAEAEGQVDVLKFVRDMRNQRFLMVQTLDQYKFIFDALLESSLSENTAISADRFHQSFAKLKKRDKKAGTTGIEAQFQMLESFTASPSEEQCMGGRSAANVDKNRFKDCVPKDSTRPYLMTKGDEGSTNYINATFLDGYNTKHAYLATQAPLPNTRGDMWRMVFDYKASCIVMLNSMDNDPSVVEYWPEKDSLEFGPLTVTLTNEDRYSEDIIIRQFDVSYPARKNDEVQSVCQIQYLGWPPGKEVPRSPSSLLKVLEAVKMWTTDHPDGPITVHCIDGVGCSGTFCAILTLLDQLAVEKDVDVFQAIKKLRITRAGMVNTLAQYQLCYQVIQTSLDSGSIYENY
ncbi:receptor-type tyrosine-protein phosphatase delta-like [Patiria miniata]|uniref:protein-tyrosine-phosphatase n=1 Tax=Patiria miniata TaxID=46514 RepID=A0A914AT25_PATMI|nr:receptor-type tyrosine-protein phosphatase delta-like [Patiria miniata]